MTWYSVHIGYHDNVNDLVLDAVRPLHDRLVGVVHRMYWVPHWHRGPHLRINVDCAAERFADTVLPTLEETMGSYLSRHPSTTVLGPEELLPVHRRLATAERVREPLTPWYPNNSVQVAEYDNRESVLGSAEAAEFLADFYAETTELAFLTSERVRAGVSRLAIAFDTMIATAHLFCPNGITDGFFSFRSHAEAFLENFPEADGRRRVWADHRQANRVALASRVRAVVSDLDSAGSRFPLVRRWRELAVSFHDRGGRLVRDGLLVISPLDDSSADGRPIQLADLSDFHRVLDASVRWRRDVRAASWFQTYRLMLNCTYLHLTRTGVRPMDRFFLCYLAAYAVEDAFGVSAVEMLREEQPTRPARTESLPQ